MAARALTPSGAGTCDQRGYFIRRQRIGELVRAFQIGQIVLVVYRRIERRPQGVQAIRGHFRRSDNRAAEFLGDGQQFEDAPVIGISYHVDRKWNTAKMRRLFQAELPECKMALPIGGMLVA